MLHALAGLLHALNNLALLLGWCVLTLWAGALVWVCWTFARAVRATRHTRQALNANAVLVARWRESMPVYHEDPSGRVVRLIGPEECPEWPAELLR